MRENEVLERAFAMPLTSQAYPPGPYRFVNREYLIITYRTCRQVNSIAQERAASTTSRSPWKPELSARTPEVTWYPPCRGSFAT